jgi:hypothetical protein
MKKTAHGHGFMVLHSNQLEGLRELAVEFIRNNPLPVLAPGSVAGAKQWHEALARNGFSQRPRYLRGDAGGIAIAQTFGKSTVQCWAHIECLHICHSTNHLWCGASCAAFLICWINPTSHH